MTDNQPKTARDLSRQIAKTLVGFPPSVIGAALADITATWISYHLVLDDPEETARMRAHILSLHTGTIKTLISLNETLIKDEL